MGTGMAVMVMVMAQSVNLNLDRCPRENADAYHKRLWLCVACMCVSVMCVSCERTSKVQLQAYNKLS